MPALTIAHLSDTHIGARSALPYGTDTARNLRAVARAIAGLRLDLAAVLITGDLADDGLIESYEHLRDLIDEVLTPLGAPVLLALGNHDSRDRFLDVFAARRRSEVDGRYCYSEDIGGVRIVMLDSNEAGSIDGRLGPEQLAYLDAELDREAAGGHVVAVHHPAIPPGIPRRDDYLLRDREAFVTVLRRHDVLAVLCGHSHEPAAGTFGGTLHVLGAASAYRVEPSRHEGARCLEGAGFGICTIVERRLVLNTVMLPTSGRDLHLH